MTRHETVGDLPRDVLDNLHEGCQVIGPDYRCLYVNDAAAAHGRNTKEALLGRTLTDVYAGIESTGMFATLRRCMEERTQQCMENQFTFPDGSTGWFELRFEPVPAGVAILSVDLTDRKRAESALARSSRALAVLSECNQTLVRAPSEERLVQDVCRVVVDKGGYLMAWIGFKIDDEERSVKPVASAGRDDGYTDLVRVTWDDSERGSGPLGRSIQTGEVCVVRFVAEEPDFAPWRAEALARGFSSVLSLPIRDAGNILGALAIYAAEPDAFDSAERALLEEMALDLGYGIKALRASFAGRQAEERVRHLNAVLRGIRGVDQLITRERDPHLLIQNACSLLVESRGYNTCCIVLCDDGRIEASADAGAEANLRAMRQIIAQGELPECMRSALQEDAVVVRLDPAATCKGCPVNSDHAEPRDAAATRLASEGKVFGVLLVSLSTGVIADQEELDLLREVSDDLAFALQSIWSEAGRRKAERALDRERARFRSLLDAVSEVAWAARPDRGGFYYLSPSAATLYGRPLDELTANPDSWIDAVHPEDRERVEANAAELLSSGHVDHEYRIVRPDGEVRWVHDRKAIVRDEVGTPVQIGGIVTDVTKRKLDEENLVAFSRRLERLTSVVQDLSQARSMEAIVEIVRHAVRGLASSDGATFVLRDHDLSHYVDEDAIAPLWKGKRLPMSECISGWVMLNGQPAVIDDIYSDERIPRDAYEPTFVKSLVMVPIWRESPIGAIGSYWATQYRASDEDVRILQALADSTSVAMENVRVMGELAEGKARIRAIYDHLPTPTFVWRRGASGFLLEDRNDAARTATKGAIERFLGARAASLSHVFPDIEKDLASCFEGHATVRRDAECNLPGADGTRRLVLTYGFIPTDMVILLTEDVTELRQAEDQLMLVQRLEAVGRLAGGVAHDFNNLLSVIISNAEFAIDELREDDPVRADVIEIRKAGERAAALTRQLLAFSRKQILEPELVDVNEVVTGIESMLRRLLGEDMAIEIHLAHDPGSVLADPGQLEQVLVNLSVNARDAMPRGGKLTIETAGVELDEDDARQHASVRSGRFIMLAVTDTGAGMDAQTKAHIFEPFFTTKEAGKGTGLGLATVYGIVKQSGGNVRVDSEPGRGTTFRVYLPRVEAPPAGLRRRPVPVGASGNETVLVVEDEEGVRHLAERILRRAGYRVLVARGGAEALAVCQRHEGPLDLLLTDVVMPEMSGRELAERLIERSPRIAVLYMSGYTDNAIVHHGILDAGTRFIGKPFSVAELTSKVRAVLDDRPMDDRDP